MKWFRTKHEECIPSTTYKQRTQQHLTCDKPNTNKIYNSFEMETNTWKLIKPQLGNVDIFAYVFMLIRLTESMENILQNKTSFTHSCESI